MKKGSLKDTPRSPQIGLRFPIPEGFLALILEKRTLMFWKFHDSLPIWLSGAISELKMAANSTYWKAKLDLLQPGVWGLKKREKNHRFGLNHIIMGPRKTILKDTPGTPQSSPCFPVPAGFLALILKKRTLLFQEALNSLPIRWTGAISELKMAVNSTYWKAKLDFLQPGVCGRK